MNKQVRRRWLRKEGLCVDDCGKVATINGNGEKSIRCDSCRAAFASPRRYIRPPQVKPAGRPVMVDPDGEIGSYYDTPEFREYTVLVAMTIKGINEPATIGDIKRALGDEFSERFNLLDVLEMLQTAGDIERVQDVPPMKWAYSGALRKSMSYQDYGRIPTYRADKTRPIIEKYEARASY